MLLDYEDRDARREFARALEAQSENVLRSAICMTTEAVGRQCMGEDQWRHEHLHHFHVKYADGPTYVACVAKPDHLCTREGVRRLMAKLRPHFTVSVGVRFTYESSDGNVTVDTSMEADAFRVAKILDAAEPAHEKVAQSVYLCQAFQREKAEDMVRTMRDQGRLPPQRSACGMCDQVMGGHRYEVRPRASGGSFALEVTAYPACVVCIPADASTTIALGEPEVARAVLRDRLVLELRARAAVRLHAAVAARETGEQAMARCARLASAVCAIPTSSVDGTLRATVETAALETVRAHPHTAGVLRRAVEHVGGETALAALQTLLHGARKCHACGHFKDADAYTPNQWRQRLRRCCACHDAGVARGAYLEVDDRAAEDEDCPICFRTVADTEARRTLHGDARHWVCAACLRDMQTYGLNSCPTCRTELV